MACKSIDGSAKEDLVKRMACKSLDGVVKEREKYGLQRPWCREGGSFEKHGLQSIDGAAKEDPLKSMACKSIDGVPKEDP